ncbi:hypothetical protein BUALT_Bualt12G0077500 [Buddleja alternifolia]|uniref:AUGMIN subunit 8 n=1 Tax=Buddleja alternifolia TaxID=168488 RepID=A0AAV6X063_9LAMI|nr:hypothetical protein BUALT_Bualt12G0077500 [Buddleja alternifolia]
MDVYESEKALEKQSTATETTRPPLVPAENKNGTTRRSRTREVSSRYRSPTPTGPKRYPSPNTSSTSNVFVPKRAISAERKRPSTQSSPPSTPIQDTAVETLLASRKMVGNKLSESLWPSRMRSLNVSFQSDTISVPVSRREKEKPVSHTPSDRALRPSSNATSRKPTPERKRSPLKGKNFPDQLENSKPLDTLHARLVDQHRWPSRNSGNKSTSQSRSISFTDKTSITGTPSLRRLSLDGTSSTTIQKSASDLLMLISRDESRKEMLNGSSVDDSLLRVRRPSSRSHPPSPSVSRGVSPSRAKTVNPSSRGPSPARVRQSSPSRQPQNSTSVLSFIADIKKGQKAANHIEDVHQLRMLYNRHLQWRYANAQTDAALHSQKVKAEKLLYNVWRTIAGLWDSVVEKRFELQQLRLKLKLYSILSNQTTFLDKWASIERDHTNSLTSAIQDLQTSTLRVPITGGAKGDIEAVNAAVCSAVNVMQAMGSSLCSTISEVESTNCLISELAHVAARERAMLGECESLLSSTTALQVEENSLRTNLLQMKQAWINGETSNFDC